MAFPGIFAETCNNMEQLRIYTIWDLSGGGFTMGKQVKKTLLSVLIFIGVVAGLFALLWGVGFLIFRDSLDL